MNDTRELLSRCLNGLTQNQNESVNGDLWNRCLKTMFCGKVKVELALAETICHFNTGAGAGADASLHEGYRSNISSYMLASLHEIDKNMLQNNHGEIPAQLQKEMLKVEIQN